MYLCLWFIALFRFNFFFLLKLFPKFILSLSMWQHTRASPHVFLCLHDLSSEFKIVVVSLSLKFTENHAQM